MGRNETEWNGSIALCRKYQDDDEADADAADLIVMRGSEHCAGAQFYYDFHSRFPFECVCNAQFLYLFIQLLFEHDAIEFICDNRKHIVFHYVMNLYVCV